jgi:MFS family permease
LFGTAEDFLDAVYQYPGGWIADRFGRRRAFLIFLALATVGYLIYLLGPSWPYAFVGLAFVMAWQSMASPCDLRSDWRCAAAQTSARWASQSNRF